MDFRHLSTVFAEAAPAQGATGNTVEQMNPTARLIQTIGMFVLLGVMMYFVMLRPQQKRAREQAEMLKSIKAGDKIVTTGGIIGVVVTVKEKSVSFRSADAKMEITKSAVAEIIERSGESSAS